MVIDPALSYRYYYYYYYHLYYHHYYFIGILTEIVRSGALMGVPVLSFFLLFVTKSGE